ncbi:hypothetical protein BDA96_09G008100 [Sorghum bicolor]|uniref:Uncharacterized protein n=1 Tax=Sorghum bicolor TaxID=4558 RepID=A0A921Q9B4_SORBI|nr:hypothetical protein BDA96_09G008100 [Sorghum bicolor]
MSSSSPQIMISTGVFSLIYEVQPRMESQRDNDMPSSTEPHGFDDLLKDVIFESTCSCKICLCTWSMSVMLVCVCL